MDCDEVVDRMSEYFDGELERGLTRQIDQHLADCSSCAEELRCFAALGELVAGNTFRGLPAVPWQRLSDRLASQTVNQGAARPGLRYRLAAVIAGVALAASILFVFGPQFWSEKTVAGRVPDHGIQSHSEPDLAINFQPFLVGPTSHPVAAYQALRTEFAGREAAADEATTLLGYQPSIARALPEGIQLISTHVLKLPHCNCAGTRCTCGPGGCHCAASLCEREDGSSLLVVEHCHSQRISFGDIASEVVKHQSHEFEWLNTGNPHAATWIWDLRRLTAIGLKGKEEAASLVSGVASL